MDSLRAAFGIALFVFVINASVVNGEDRSPPNLGYFDLPVQALQISLVEFGLQARVTIIADTELLKGQRSSPVIGPLSVETALRNLLATTALTYRYDLETQAYIIEKSALVEPTEISVTPVDVDPTPPSIEEVLVKSLRLPFRYQTIANSQMLGDVAYFDSSRFINKLPNVLIEDMHPKEIGQVLKYASGITPGEGLGDSNDDFYIRGFRRNAMYVDGFRSSDVTGLKLIPANIEHVEILKGPSTLLFGQAEPGGIVNAIRKKPLDETFLTTEVGGGSFGQRYLTIDANTPVIDDVDARLVIFDEAQDESAEISNIERRLVAPSAIWHLSPETELWVSYEYQWESRELYDDYSVIEFYDAGRNFSLGDGVKSARPEFSAESNFLSLSFTHYFTDEWQFNAQYFWHDEDRFGVRAAADKLTGSGLLYDVSEFNANTMLYIFSNNLVVPRTFYPATPEPVSGIGTIRSIYDEQGFETNNNIKLKLDGTFDFVTWTHHLTLGSEWYQQDIFKDYTIESRNLFPGRLWTDSEFDSDALDIILTVIDPYQPLGALEQKEVRLVYDDFAFFAQDVIELNDRWVVTLGGRYSYLEGEHTDVTEGLITPLETYDRLSGQLGVVYKVNEDHSLYANYSEALRSNYHLDEFGANRAPPELSDQIEMGIKSILMDGRMQATLGAFEINKYDVSQSIFMIFGEGASSIQADQLIRGIDLDVTTQISPEFDVLVGMSLTDPELVSGINKGNKPVLAAEQTLSLFGHYKFTYNLELSGGIKYVSSRYTDNANIYEIEPYTTVDVALDWQKKLFDQEVKLQLGVINLLDEEYNLAGFYSGPPNLAEGRSLTASARVDW